MNGDALRRERRLQIESLCEAALARPADARAQFVRAACGDDHELCRDVEALLVHASESDRFLEQPLDAVAAHVMADAAADDAQNVTAVGGELRAGSLTGRRVDTFETGPLIGVGGMGEVYRARDTELQRDVALKVLPPGLVSNPDRLARFEREARMLASLNHPNIAAIYRVVHAGEVRALILELVDGQTLADRVAGAPTSTSLSLDEALQIARQIALALEAAHDRGIVHRDLKPANIRITPAGVVKVLDFGLAKAVDPGSNGAGVTVDTRTGQTTPGTILGTVAYMAPEQAKGVDVDRRADLWAFGCILFEMLANHRPFDGDSVPDLLVKVVNDAPDWDALPPATPASIRKLLRRCLEKDPRRRLDSAVAARLELDDALSAPVAQSAEIAAAGVVPDRTTGSTPMPGAHRHWPRRVVLFAGAAIVIAIAVWTTGRRPGHGPTGVLRLHSPTQVTSSLGVENYPTWSPDGSRIAYQASEGGYGGELNHDVWVSQVGRGNAINLTNGAGDNLMPSWSPDGREIAFFSNRSPTWAVYTVSAIGGRPRQVLPLPDINASNWSAPQWSSDASKLHVSVSQKGKNIVIVLSLASLQATHIELPDHEGTVVWNLSLRSDGLRYAYVSGGGGATEVTRLWTIPTTGGEPVPLTDGYTNVWSPRWSTNGRKLYYVANRGGAMDLWQQAVGADGTPAGAPASLTEGLGIQSAAFSSDGRRVAYSRGAWVSNVWRVPIFDDRPATWSDATPITSEHAFVEFVDVSPDGTQLAVSSDRRGNQDLWVMPSGGGEMTPLTTDPAPDWNPRWSPDGREIAFYSFRSGNRDIWVMPSVGGPARQLTSNPRRESEPSWSPDGRDILFRSRGPQATWIVSAGGSRPRLLAEGFGAGPEWSPDGTWVLLSKQGRLYRVPRAGGSPMLLPFAPRHRQFQPPRFSKDGRFLFYTVIAGPKADQNLWKLSLDDGAVSPLTQLEGRRGVLGWVFAADARYLYFTWREDDGDIWVMDVDE